jgi:hypothetical protein
MASTTGPRNGIQHSWSLGESGWNTGNDANLKYMDNFGMHLSVKDRDLLSPPGTPANGDTYILASGTLTGAWSARAAGDLAMWSSQDGGWRFKTPRTGFFCYIEDEQKLSVFKAGTGWSAGIAI